MIEPPVCPQHHVSGVLVDDAYLYGGRSYGQVWRCPEKACDYRVGAHKGSGLPKGTMADYPLREARKRAHAIFDGWWQTDKLKRGEAYRILKEETGVEHIAEADLAQCRLIVERFMPLAMGAGVRARRERQQGGIRP